MNRWTKDEIDLLNKLYPNKTNEELTSFFPRHPRSSIQDKARDLALKKHPDVIRRAISEGWKKVSRVWTKNEILILTKLFPKATMDKLVKELPNRSKNAIFHKGERFGLERPTDGQFKKGFKRSRGSRRKQAKTVSGDNNVSKRLDVRRKISKALRGRAKPWFRGEKNPRWRGGYEPYYGPNWYFQRDKRLKRDKYCQRCGTNEDLVVHHIVPFREFGREGYKEANKLSNLITLCRSCHRSVENGQPLRLP